MEHAFLKKLIDREFNNLTQDELLLIVNNHEVFALKKKDLNVIEKLIDKGIEPNKDKISQVLEEALPPIISILNNLDQQAIYGKGITIDFRGTLQDNLNQMNQLQLCVFINKVLKFRKDNKLRFFRKAEFSLHEINGVVSRSLGLSLVFEIFKTGKAKSFTAIDYNKIDKALMVATLNNHLVRYLYILEIISRVVLNTEEDKIFGTKINKNIREEILPYVILLDKERKTIAKTGIKPKKTWVYTLCDSINIELADDDYDDEEDFDE